MYSKRANIKSEKKLSEHQIYKPRQSINIKQTSKEKISENCQSQNNGIDKKTQDENSSPNFRIMYYLTNEILVNKQADKRCDIICYIPAYFRAKLKNIVSMDFENLSAQVNITFILDVYYGALGEEDKAFLKQNMMLEFPRNPPVYLKQGQLLVTVKNQKDNCFRFLVKKAIDAQINNNIVWSPFDTANIIISAQMKKIKRKDEQNNRWIKYKFNFMDAKDSELKDLKFSLGTEQSFGYYNIAEKQMRAVYSNCYESPDLDQRHFSVHVQSFLDFYDKCCKKKTITPDGGEEDDEMLTRYQQEETESGRQIRNKEKISSFNYAYFFIPMYKSPQSVGLLIFLQLLLISFINYGIFLQDRTKSGKQMLNMAALMVSLIGILPNIRQSMGRSSQITLAEICTLTQILCIILAFIHMIINLNTFQYDTGGQQWKGESLSIISILVTVTLQLVLLVCYVLHLTVWKEQYHYEKKKYNAKWFNRKLWCNQDCDIEFLDSHEYEQGRIFMLSPKIQSAENKSIPKDSKNRLDLFIFDKYLIRIQINFYETYTQKSYQSKQTKMRFILC